MKNTISMTIHLVNGSQDAILESVSISEAIEFLYPDSVPPVFSIVIEAITDDGKQITLELGKDRISGSID